jgi:hypothetical protein
VYCKEHSVVTTCTKLIFFKFQDVFGNKLKRRERESGEMGGLKRDLTDEEESVCGRADRVRVAASGDGTPGREVLRNMGVSTQTFNGEEEVIWPDVHRTAHQSTPDS